MGCVCIPYDVNRMYGVSVVFSGIIAAGAWWFRGG
jgi:hypothetical protein